MNRIRVLQFLTNFRVGGTERAVVNLAWGLDPSGFEIYFGCLRRWGEELLSEIEERKVPVTEYHIPNLYNAHAWSQRLRFARDLRRERIRVVNSYGFGANVFAIPAARLAGVPAVVASMQDLGTDLTPLRRRMQRLVCRLAHRIVVNAEAVRRYLIADGYAPEKVVVIHTGIDLSRFRTRRGDGRLRRELGLPPHAPLVAVFARLIRLKGLERFLEAASLLAPRVPDARFLVVGGEHESDPTYPSELKRYAARLGLGDRVMFTGFRLDIPEILSEITVSALPSFSEGLSNSILEAMAAGVPVVATHVGGNAEAVQDGVTGFLVPPQDAPALAHAIGQLLENPELAARFGAAARERMVRHFSMERYVRETDGLYSALLADARRRRPARETTHAQGYSETR